ncbi:MAG: hypothetical protein AAB453_04900 [Patescibacteria group bacterium]
MPISLRDFIRLGEKSPEASVLVAENISEVSEYTKLLEDLGYFCVVDSVEARKYFSEGKKIYGPVSEKTADFYYNLAKDYAGGDIHLFDFAKKEKIWITPKRETSAFVLIIQLKDIENLKIKGYDFATICDSAYRK